MLGLSRSLVLWDGFGIAWKQMLQPCLSFVKPLGRFGTLLMSLFHKRVMFLEYSTQQKWNWEEFMIASLFTSLDFDLRGFKDQILAIVISFRDISKRTFLARFSSPSNSVFQFLPISLVRWQSEGHGDPINNIIAATKTSLLEQGENHVSIPIEGEDVAIWIFVSTVCNSDVQHDLESSNHKINPVGFWRLALLAKNRVILGMLLQ
ncbi:hypothetical protein CsSME_00043488 [Camellia sinensis var. sinensis]